MAMADEDITVNIEDEKPLVVEDGQPEAPDTTLDALKTQLETSEAAIEHEKQARIAAEQREARERDRAAVAEQDAQTARTEVTDSRLSTVESGLASAQTEASAAEAAYAAAMEAGNFADAAKQQRRMARAEAESVRLTEAKADLEIAKASPRVERRKEEPRDAPRSDQVETFINTRDSATQAWLRNHMDDARVLATGNDQRRAAKLNAADNDAVAEGFERGSKDYFAHIENFLGMTQKEEPKANGQDGKVQVNAHQRRSPAAPVAPVNAGSSAGATNGGGTEVRLTKGEAQSATDGTLVYNYDDPSPQKKFKKGDPIGIQEFARRKKAMAARGEYDKSYTEN